MKWGIHYNGKIYVEVYGKKKAHDLLYQLSMCLEGLRVAGIQPKQKALSRKERQSRPSFIRHE
ncbi:hypothetical protein [Paenibacillus piri]|uniref:Uncharacterized protein n=1 Tax=Paenibacillus piri TaxID=2547395 RepID=A0A4R5KWY3_9BACL|nr:hypothetical protein [Paenibacillus piri]TDG00327.1 hypothetical protein E1757_01400 [Paenibacillus piri]